MVERDAGVKPAVLKRRNNCGALAFCAHAFLSIGVLVLQHT